MEQRMRGQSQKCCCEINPTLEWMMMMMKKEGFEGGVIGLQFRMNYLDGMTMVEFDPKLRCDSTMHPPKLINIDFATK